MRNALLVTLLATSTWATPFAQLAGAASLDQSSVQSASLLPDPRNYTQLGLEADNPVHVGKIGVDGDESEEDKTSADYLAKRATGKAAAANKGTTKGTKAAKNTKGTAGTKDTKADAKAVKASATVKGAKPTSTAKTNKGAKAAKGTTAKGTKATATNQAQACKKSSKTAGKSANAGAAKKAGKTTGGTAGASTKNAATKKGGKRDFDDEPNGLSNSTDKALWRRMPGNSERVAAPTLVDWGNTQPGQDQYSGQECNFDNFKKCHDPKEFDRNFFLAELECVPPADKCIFYTRHGSTDAQKHCAANPSKGFKTIWDLWPAEYYNGDQTPDNPFRCLIQPDLKTAPKPRGWPFMEQRDRYFRAMSDAFAYVCNGRAYVIEQNFKDGGSMEVKTLDGIFGNTEYPRLQKDGSAKSKLSGKPTSYISAMGPKNEQNMKEKWWFRGMPNPPQRGVALKEPHITRKRSEAFDEEHPGFADIPPALRKRVSELPVCKPACSQWMYSMFDAGGDYDLRW